MAIGSVGRTVLLLLLACCALLGSPATAAADTALSFGSETIPDQNWTQSWPVALTLPEATGGNGPLTYSLSPQLPGG